MGLAAQWQASRAAWRALWRRIPHVACLLLLAASVWIVFGLGFKLLGFVPRHASIVARVLGGEWAVPLTVLVGLGECALAAWILSGLYPRLCAAAQTAAILSMNTLELALARDLLLTPLGMVCANLVFLSLVWYASIRFAALTRANPC